MPKSEQSEHGLQKTEHKAL